MPYLDAILQRPVSPELASAAIRFEIRKVTRGDQELGGIQL